MGALELGSDRDVTEEVGVTVVLPAAEAAAPRHVGAESALRPRLRGGPIHGYAVVTFVQVRD